MANLKDAVNDLCDVIMEHDLEVNDALAALGSVVEMILINGVAPEGRATAANNFQRVVYGRIGLMLN